MVSKQHSGSHLLILTLRPSDGLQLLSTVFHDWELWAQTVVNLLLCLFWQCQICTVIQLMYLHSMSLSLEVSWETTLEFHSCTYATVTESGVWATILSLAQWMNQKKPCMHQKKTRAKSKHHSFDFDFFLWKQRKLPNEQELISKQRSKIVSFLNISVFNFDYKFQAFCIWTELT